MSSDLRYILTERCTWNLHEQAHLCWQVSVALPPERAFLFRPTSVCNLAGLPSVTKTCTVALKAVVLFLDSQASCLEGIQVAAPA